jgi:division protein 1
MDILWAISHPQPSIPGNGLPNYLFPGAAASAGHFAVPTPPYADGSWEMYQDFVGGVQFWGYGLVSGSGDGAVRMWDSKSLWSPFAAPNVKFSFPVRTGQAHRTLMGHTGPVTCLQFDEMHIASGSLDKSVRVSALVSIAVCAVLNHIVRYGTSGRAAHSKLSSMIML